MEHVAEHAADPIRTPSVPRASLATLPTPLEAGPRLAGGDDGPRLWVKRDDLTGLGGGGNKARKLEFLCGDALAGGARALVTVGAGQSNHCRMTAAAGARLGLEAHLVLAGDAPADGEPAEGNQLLSGLFGAQLHFTGAAESHWGELEIAREALTDALSSDGLAPASIPIGGSTATGAIGYAVAFAEIVDQCRERGFVPAAVVVTSSSGGTHAGLLAGRAALLATGELDAATAPDVVAVGVAKGVVLGHPTSPRSPTRSSSHSGSTASGSIRPTSRSTIAGSGPTTPSRPRPATRRSDGAPGRAVGSSTGRTRARGCRACSAWPPRVDGRPTTTSFSCTPAAGPPCSPPAGCPTPLAARNVIP